MNFRCDMFKLSRASWILNAIILVSQFFEETMSSRSENSTFIISLEKPLKKSDLRFLLSILERYTIKCVIKKLYILALERSTIIRVIRSGSD